MKAIRAGKMDQRAMLLDVNEATVDEWGQPVQPTVEIAEVWLQVEPLRGMDLVANHQVNNLATHKVTLRWLGSLIPSTPDNPFGLLRPKMKFQLIKDNSILNILSATDEEKAGRKWICICAERIGATT